MSVRYEVTKTDNNPINDRIRIWHDEDPDDKPCYDGAVRDFLYDYADPDNSGVLWNSMEQFDDDFSDCTPRCVAMIVRDGFQWCGPTTLIHGLDVDDMYYGRVIGRGNDGPYVSLANRDVLERWIYENVDLGKLVVWYAENHLPKR